MKLEFDLYTPAEAEVVTEVTQATVRNWRRAGYLARPQGHARYDLGEILRLVGMRALTSRGVTPEFARRYAGEISMAIFHNMIFSEKNYSHGVREAFRQEASELDQAEIQLIAQEFGDKFSPEEIGWAYTLKRMTDAAEAAIGFRGRKSPNWLIIWANGEMEFYYEDDSFEEKFFGDTVYDEYVQGPVTLFCLGAIAQMVSDRLPRPPFRLNAEG